MKNEHAKFRFFNMIFVLTLVLASIAIAPAPAQAQAGSNNVFLPILTSGAAPQIEAASDQFLFGGCIRWLPTLKNGSEGDLVELVQDRLNRKIRANLVVDGDFGPRTKGAVKAIQILGKRKYTACGKTIVVDGMVGPQTWWLILEAELP